MIQGSDEWFQDRCGKVTASRIADLMAKTKSGWGASRANYMAQLIAERLTNNPADSYTSSAMQWGIDNEPLARAAYEFHNNITVDLIGFVHHPEISMAGASPDGLINDDGLIEIKCPNTSTHIDTLISGKVPNKYILQMQWQMACCKRDWCDFVSFDPRMPEQMKLFVQRIFRDDDKIKEITVGVQTFLADVDAKIQLLLKRAA